MILRIETEPGQRMQVEWATIRRGRDRLSVFVATMGWSRSSYVEFCDDEKVETSPPLELMRPSSKAAVIFIGLGGWKRKRKSGIVMLV